MKDLEVCTYCEDARVAVVSFDDAGREVRDAVRGTRTTDRA